MSNQNNIDQCPDELSEAGVADVCKGCPGQRLCRESFNMIDPDIEDIKVRMNVIKHKILVMSGKGGVGKSTFASSLAILLAKKSYKVGVVDLDICGPSIELLLKCNGQTIVSTPWGWKPAESPHYNIKVISVASLLDSSKSAVIYKGPRKTNLIKRILKETFWGKLDFLIFDTPPGTSDEHLTVIKFLQSLRPDGAVIVTTPQKMAVNTIRKEITFCNKMKLNIIGIAENMSFFSCPCCKENNNLFTSSGCAKELAAQHSIDYLGILPFSQKLTSNSDIGQSIIDTEIEVTDSRAKDREAVAANVREQVRRLMLDDGIMAKVRSGELLLVGAFYEISSGIVDFLQEVDG